MKDLPFFKHDGRLVYMAYDPNIRRYVIYDAETDQPILTEVTTPSPPIQ